MLRFDSMLSCLILKWLPSSFLCASVLDLKTSCGKCLNEACPPSIKWDNKGPTQSWSIIVASYRILVSRLKALSGKILWECFRCKLEDSDYIILETIQCAEEYSADSSTSSQSSSLGVHRVENGSLVNLLVYCVCQGGAREFGLVEGPITNILVGAFWLQNHGLLLDLYWVSNHQVCGKIFNKFLDFSKIFGFCCTGASLSARSV